MIAIKTEISESIDTAPSEVEVEPTHTINEVASSHPPFSYYPARLNLFKTLGTRR